MKYSGICDNDGVQILTTRIFDNVRIELDRTALSLSTAISSAAVTALYASGTGTLVPDSNISVAPDLNCRMQDITGTLSLQGTVTYISGGARSTAPATLKLPISVRMALPDQAIWPYDITVHYSYFADNLTEAGVNEYNALVDGVVIVYVTSLAPITLKGTQPVVYNPSSERTVTSCNTFTASRFYPTNEFNS